MDKNYFSDITELFIKAKQAEKIEVNPHSKAAIREMLAYKVDEMKAAEEAPGGNFFNKWKFQLMGVPASVFAVFLLVFAFQNLQITMPKEDFAPGATEGSSMERSEAEIPGTSEASEAEPEILDKPGISDKPEIKDIPIIEEVANEPKPEPELMVIDYGETAQPTTTTQPKTGGGPVYTAPAYTPPTETVEEAVYVAPIQQPAIVESTQSSDDSADTYTPPTTSYTPQTSEPTYDIYTPTTSNGYTLIDLDVDTVQTPNLIPVPQVDAPQYEINPDTVNNMMDGGILLPQTDEPSDEGNVNEFRDPFNPLVPEFDTEALNTIEKPDTLSNVNVHYLNRDQAAVEVVDDDTTRWYMFETIDGTWTVTQKFD